MSIATANTTAEPFLHHEASKRKAPRSSVIIFVNLRAPCVAALYEYRCSGRELSFCFLAPSINPATWLPASILYNPVSAWRLRARVHQTIRLRQRVCPGAISRRISAFVDPGGALTYT
jgi:hypothetical protein